MSHEPLRDPPRLLDASSTDPLLRDALRVVRTDTPELASLNALADGVQHAISNPGVTTTVASATGGSALKLVLAAVVACAGMYGAYRLATATAERAAPRDIEAPPAAPPVAIDRPHTATTARPTLDQPTAPVPTHVPTEEPRDPGREPLAPSPTRLLPLAPAPVTRVHTTIPHRERARPKLAQPEAAAEASRDEQVTTRQESKRGEDEVTLLESAQRMLQDNPQGALERLSEHRERFPSGAFAQEREALYIDALQRVGRTGEARSRARAFLESWPQSPHRARIQRLIDGE